MSNSLASSKRLTRAQLEAEAKKRGLPIPPPRKPLDCETAPPWFHSHQLAAWNLKTQISIIAAGWQSGKTVALPPWLLREIQRHGPGDYGAFSSTFKLLNRKFLPELKKTFGPLCEWRASDQQFHFTPSGSAKLWGASWDKSPTVIQLGYTENPDSIESATLKAAVWDEPGQKLVPEQSFDTIQSRLMVHRGRMMLASRFYQAGWFERMAREGLAGDTKAGVVSFPSWANPVNPPQGDPYWEDLQRRLPSWKFAIFYEGRFERPAGAVYDCFDTRRHTLPAFRVPDHWKRFMGIDFGTVHTAAVFVAEEKRSDADEVTGRYIIYREYPLSGWGSKPTGEHVQAMLKGEPRIPVAYGGWHGEGDSREAFAKNGLPVREPLINEVEAGITKVYSLLGTDRLLVTRDCPRTIDQLSNYSYELGPDDEPIPGKINNKSIWHLCDSARYVCSAFPDGEGSGGVRGYTFGKKTPAGRWFAGPATVQVGQWEDEGDEDDDAPPILGRWHP